MLRCILRTVLVCGHRLLHTLFAGSTTDCWTSEVVCAIQKTKSTQEHLVRQETCRCDFPSSLLSLMHFRNVPNRTMITRYSHQPATLVACEHHRTPVYHPYLKVVAVRWYCSFLWVCCRLEAIEAEHGARQAGLRDDFLSSAAKLNSAGSVEAALDKSGGWASDQHFRSDVSRIRAALGTGT